MKPIIIYRLGSLGDTIVALPCFIKIADSFPHSKRIVLTNFPISSSVVPLEELLRPANLIDEVIEYKIGMRSIFEIFQLRKSLKSTGAETLIYLNAGRSRLNIFRDLIFFYFCGIKHIIGAPLTKDLFHGKFNSNLKIIEPESSRLSRTISELGIINLKDNYFWDLKFTDHEINSGINSINIFEKKPFFVINMGGKSSEKDWGLNKWKSLMISLSELNKDIGLVIIGSSYDIPRAQQIISGWRGTSLNLCGTLSSRECGCFISKAFFFIGHDSGPLHLAALVKTPSLGLFGNYNAPIKWHPTGPQVSILHDMRGIDYIAVEDVILALKKLVNI